MRYTPFESLDRMVEQMRRDMMDWRGDDWAGVDSRARANMDLAEHDGEFVLTADLPGFEREEISLRIDDDTIHLSARHSETDDSHARSRSIEERMSLPKPVVEDEATATYRNGVLQVHLPLVAGAEESGHVIDIE